MADRPHDACSSTGCYKRKSVKSAFFEGGGSHWVQISDGRECRPPTALGDRKQEWLPLRAVPYQSIRSALFGFVTKHAYDTQTDGQNYDSQDCASIAASCGKKW